MIVYPISKGRQERTERASASRCTSDLRQKMNDRTSAQRFRRLIAANFGSSDYVVTLTYSDETLPATPELARDKKLKPFVRRLRSELSDLGFASPPYMYVTEGLHGDKRLHHHIILPRVPYVDKIVRNLWKRNGYADFETIASRGYDVWSKYLTKEPRKTGRRRVGDRMWTPSIGLKQPKVTTYQVDDDRYLFDPPNGVIIEMNELVETEFFTCQYLSYRIPSYKT